MSWICRGKGVLQRKEHNIDPGKHVTRANIQKSTREQRVDGIWLLFKPDLKQ